MTTKMRERWLRRPGSKGLATLVVMVGFSTTCVAHEFWLEAIGYRVKVGTSIPIVQRSGMELQGLSYPYLSEDTRRFATVTNGVEAKIEAIEGDDPAAEVVVRQPGLVAVIYHGAINTVEFATFSKFEESARFEHLDHIVEAHRRSSKPNTRIVEGYARCAKALIGVGHARGSDRATGLPLEMIAERNPYELRSGDVLPVQILLEGKPLAGVTIKVFTSSTAKDPRRIVADANGRAQFSLEKSGEHMLHAVFMREPRKGEPGHWFSLWASLTFKIPE